ncbi:MAG: GNAT family N-acetyltransferase [Haloarculaceae archaeon]
MAGDEQVGAGRADAEAVVRRYEPADEAAVRRVHERALLDAGTDPADVPGTADLGWIEAAYVEPGGEFLVAEADGEVVATGGLVVDDRGGSGGDDADDPVEGELFRLAVDPDHQREGYGTAVLDGLEAAARERGVDRLALTTARRQAAATEFYPARGYERVGRERHGEYELIRFEKRLD